ncbi:MAG: hypothetical protein CMJ76_15150 [Planctomycetaceae bacterium]|nr:hypothetical protein [Planctomycetaceae bacterium]
MFAILRPFQSHSAGDPCPKRKSAQRERAGSQASAGSLTECIILQNYKMDKLERLTAASHSRWEPDEMIYKITPLAFFRRVLAQWLAPRMIQTMTSESDAG